MPDPALSDNTIKYLPRLLAESVRDLLNGSPSDEVAGIPAGRLTIERAWLPVFELHDTAETVISVVPGSDAGEVIARGGLSKRQVSVVVSVQKLLCQPPNTADGKEELDEAVDFAERCLQAAGQSLRDRTGRQWSFLSYERGLDSDALNSWNQMSVVAELLFVVMS